MATQAPPRFPETKPAHHTPSGEPSWPRILLSGPEGARKSWTLAELSAHPDITGMFWLEIGNGENTAEEYGRIPGVKYEIIDHDGTYADIYRQLCVHWWLAHDAEARGETWALGVDSMSGLWDMLQAFGDLKVRRREEARLRAKNLDPAIVWTADYDAQITPDVWGYLLRKRIYPIYAILLGWPGPVGYTGREKLATPFDSAGNPIAKADKVWSLETHKSLPGVSTAWMRLTREGPPEVVKLRSVDHGIAVTPGGEADAVAVAPAPKVGRDGAPRVTPDRRTTRPWKGDRFTLGSLIFDTIGCTAGKSRAPKIVDLDADQDMPDDTPASPEEKTRSAAVVKTGVAKILGSANQEQAEAWLARTRENGLGDRDVTAHLTDTDRETLAIPADRAVTLRQLAETVVQYCAKHGDGPRVDPGTTGGAEVGAA